MNRLLKKMLSGVMVFVLASTCIVTSDTKTMWAEGKSASLNLEGITCEERIEDGKNGEIVGMIEADDVVIKEKTYHNYAHYSGLHATATTELQDAGNAIDGKLNSRWESTQGLDNQSITIDLGNVYAVKGLAAYWEGASAKTYTLQVSENGRDFQDMKAVASNYGERTELLTFSEEVNIRAVRFACETRNTPYGFSIFEVGIFGSEGQKEEIKMLSNLSVENYYAYSGKYMLYFNEESGATGYNVYLDREATPVKQITASGSYLSAKDVEGLANGSHSVKLVALDAEGNEGSEVTAAFTKSGNAGTYTDIAQVYIYTTKEIKTEYHDEKDVTVTVVDKNGTKTKDLMASDCNIKIRGNTTAGAPKKPYNIKFNKKQSVLGMNKAKKWCLLANSFDKSLLRNYLSYNFGRENGVTYTNNNRYVEVYVNGNYQGNYLLTEAVQAKPERVDIDAYGAESNDILLELGHRDYETDVDHFTTNVLNTTFDVNDPEKDDDLENDLVDAKIARVKAYLEQFETVLRSQNYEQILQYIDEDTFVNFYIVNELFKNVDFNFSSTRFYIKDNKIYAGPMWDLDLSSGNCKRSYYQGYYGNDGLSYTGYYCQDMNWYKQLTKNVTFMGKVHERYAELQYKIQSLYRNDSVEEIGIEKALETYGDSFQRNYLPKNQLGAGWELTNDDGYSYAAESGWQTWEEPVEFLKDWLERRNDWLCQQWDVDPVQAYEVTKPGEEEPTTEEPTTEESTASQENTGVSLEINGSQISAVSEGYRVVYSVADTEEVVDNVGLIYGLGDYCSVEDMYLGSTARTVYSYENTEDGKLVIRFSENKDAESYAMIMKNIKSVDFYIAPIYVRAYARLKNGEVVYSNVKQLTVYNTADYLYKGLKMNNLSGHEYLYNAILKVVQPDYEKIDYEWSTVLAP